MNVKKRKFGIQSHILSVFFLFTVIIVGLLWIFQIIMLNPIYRTIKHDEITATADDIEENFANKNSVEYLQNITKNTGIDILIVRFDGQIIVQVSSGYSPLFSNITSKEMFASLYDQVIEKGGVYTQWGESDTSQNSSYTDYEELIYIKATQGPNAKMIILSTMVTPIDSTVDTLKIQLMYITLIMIVLSTILGIILAKKISRPIKGINEGAKQISTGNYDILLVPKGSRETQELAVTLNFTAKELSKVENLRKELIANVSHDLRTPLTMISGFAEIMRDIPGENNPENAQVVIDESNHLSDLVNDLLDVSKLEAGKENYNPEKINLTQNIVRILHRYDKFADFTFDFYHGSDIFVFGDELKLSQVICNLVNNALNYTGEDKRVILTQTVSGNFVKIDVTDTGEGIPQDKIQDIWERYYKLDKDHKTARVGTGLGLSIVKKVLQIHGGTYGVTSQLGQGSTFWFSLPIYNEEEYEEIE